MSTYRHNCIEEDGESKFINRSLFCDSKKTQMGAKQTYSQAGKPASGAICSLKKFLIFSQLYKREKKPMKQF